ncbi:MAG TPA: sigma-70 family RNA polymerase sigma factor, partial [Verrucomicrobiae bacterium]
MTEQSDAKLLRAYAQRGRETAFREIVLRHTDFVYSAALRQVESSDVAGDVAQSVFTDLARKARPLAEKMAVGGSRAGWLYRSTRFAALNQVRDYRRRLAHERQAMEQLITNSETAPDWGRVRPVLDEAMADLSEEDREALLLRYFKNQDLRAVGLALGVSDDTAQKRVSRAVERLREFFSKRNVTIGAGGLAVLISANAVQSAPAGLAGAISAAAILAGTVVSTSTAIVATKTIVMTTLQKTLITATVAIWAGAGIYEARQAGQLGVQVQTLQQQQAPLAAQIQRLQRERDNATNQIAGLLAENGQLKSNSNEIELLKLRAETTRLRSDSQALASLKADPTGAAGRVAKIKARLDQMPEKKIPELRFLTDEEWQQVAGRPNKLETDEDYRHAFSNLRERAKDLFIHWLGQALHNYAKANGGYLPADLSQLKPYFTPPALDANWKPGDPKRYELLPVEDAILQRYQLVQSGKLSEVPQVGTYPPVVVTGNADLDARNAAQREKTKTNLPWTEPVVVEKAPVDDQFDTLFTVTVYGWSYRQFGRGTGNGSGTFAKAQVGTNGVPELVDPPAAVGRR